MPRFSKSSLKRIDECNLYLRIIMKELIKVMDVTILCGYRGKKEQDEAYKNGRSKLKFPQSKHNKKPSDAIDVAPYPINWNDIDKFERMCGIIEGIAHQRGLKIRLGRDFSFKDYPHVEVKYDV